MALAAGKSTETYKDQFNLSKSLQKVIEKMAKYRAKNIFTCNHGWFFQEFDKTDECKWL